MTTPMEMLNGIDARLLHVQEQQNQFFIERQREQERLRTMKPMRYFVPPGSLPATPTSTFTLNQTDAVEEGYVWDLRVISCRLSAADNLAAFVGENVFGSPLGAPVTSLAVTGGPQLATILVPKSSGIWNGGETIFLTTGGTGNILSVRLVGWQAAGPEVGKLF